MRTNPDGAEVVATRREAERCERPPLLVIDAITDYLDSRRLGHGPVAWQRIGDGQSNITYKLARGTDAIVLRRGPRPPHPPSTHDMVREATIQQVLGAEGVAVPQILDVCDDESVLGVPFYLMDWIDGVVVTDTAPGELDSPAERRRTSSCLVHALADIHAVPVTSGKVADLGRPAGYLERQVRRFSDLWDRQATRPLPAIEETADWLDANRPATQAASVVHGDFRLGNVMLGRSAPARILSVLDWELATLGDPLADLGYLTATYSDPGGPRTPLHLSPVTAESGYRRSQDLVAEYADLTGFDVSGLAWYQTLALWKAAIFCEAIYSRWLDGERPDDRTFGPSLEAGVPALVEAAQAFSRRF
jgi:aminoglycoside phosphotransferase (APT) family kinase protein